MMWVLCLLRCLWSFKLVCLCLLSLWFLVQTFSYSINISHHGQLMIMLGPPKMLLVSCGSPLSDMNGIMQLQSLNLTACDHIQFFLRGLPPSHLLVETNHNLNHVPRSQIPIWVPWRPNYFCLHMQSWAKQTTRWKKDWELLVDFLGAFSFLGHCLFASQGKGAFSFAVKVENKIDSRIYAGANLFLPPPSTSGADISFLVKKVHLKDMQTDAKIFHKVNISITTLCYRILHHLGQNV